MRIEIERLGAFRYMWEVKDIKHTDGFVVKRGYARTRRGAERKAHRYVFKVMDERVLRHIERGKQGNV